MAQKDDVSNAEKTETIRSISEAANRLFENRCLGSDESEVISSLQERVLRLLEKEYGGPGRSPILEATDLTTQLTIIARAYTEERIRISDALLALSLQGANLSADIARDSIRVGRAKSREAVTEAIGNMLLFMFSLCNIYRLDLGTILQKTVEMNEVQS